MVKPAAHHAGCFSAHVRYWHTLSSLTYSQFRANIRERHAWQPGGLLKDVGEHGMYDFHDVQDTGSLSQGSRHKSRGGEDGLIHDLYAARLALF